MSFVQVFNPKSKEWVKIDTDKGVILEAQPEQWEGVPIAKKKTHKQENKMKSILVNILFYPLQLIGCLFVITAVIIWSVVTPDRVLTVLTDFAEQMKKANDR